MTTITTNNQARALLSFYELSERWQAEARKSYDYLDDIESQYDFFVYRGRLYHLGEFMRLSQGRETPWDSWDGGCADSCFSGVVVRLAEDSQVICGNYCSSAS